MLKTALRVLRTGFAQSAAEERSGFEFVWLILLFSGTGIVLTLLVKILFLESV